jgi:hypothetical protein
VHHYLCKERYRLELRWEGITYHDEQTAVLTGAYFTGPVLKEAQQIQSPDFIDLDLTKQHLLVFDSYYIVRLSWEGVEYCSDGTVALQEAVLSNKLLRSLHNVEDKDYILINTEKHEEELHAYNLVYDAEVMKETEEPYVYAKEGQL